ncbi:ATP-binding protein [Streptomyces sp. NPDC090029]|uniref:ATP-binding protein n=1 Tax=Streptomyces sp. NPDC090029 TaxID=3365924 RepID=UPI00380E2FD5
MGILLGGTVPADVTILVGRQPELAELRQALAVARLVTLTGTGGVGKTRLAAQAARDVRGDFPDGVVWTELTDAGDPSQLVLTVMEAVGLRTAHPESARALAESLHDKRMLLVLDNCEHLVGACGALVTGLLTSCPELRILATSREVLDVPGERVLAVAPLPVPATTPAGVAEGHRAASVVLFAERAAAADPDFELTTDNEEDVASLCRQLDGLPLAIELAAVRVRTLSVDELLRRTGERYELLARTHDGFRSRHQSLRATVDWSFELCSPAERLLWSRLAVFAGGCDLAAAENVCTDGELPGDAVLAGITGLVEKSLLVREESHGCTRYRMLETIRQYGREQLECSGEADELRRRHRDHFLRRAERLHGQWFGPGQADLFGCTRREHANIRLALEYCLDHPSPEHQALRLAFSLWTYWIVCGLPREGAIWLERALAADTEPSPQRADALWAAGLVGNYAGEADETPHSALDAVQECHRLAEALHDPARVAHATYLWGYLQLSGGDPVRGFVLLTEGVELERELGEAEEPHLRHAQLLLTTAASLAGLDDAVRQVGEECRVACQDRGEEWVQSWILLLLGVSAACGRREEAEDRLKEAVRIAYPFRDPVGIGCALGYLAWSAVQSGDFDRGARLFGASTVFLEPLGLEFGRAGSGSWTERCDRRRVIAMAKEGMGERAFRRAYGSGRRLTQDQAVKFALGDASAPAGEPVQLPRLTRRERQIADLLAEGMTNSDIAGHLVISRRTAETHVAHILDKLGCTSRAQVAVWVTEQSVGHRRGGGTPVRP